MSKKVYLAGPITGLSYGETTDWREYVKDKLHQQILVSRPTEFYDTWSYKDSPIEAYSPMRAKEYLYREQVIKDNYDYNPADVLSTAKGITTRDRWDCMTCDLLFVNFLGATKVSIGTVLEIAWADSKRTPIVMAIESDGSNIHEHAMINECVGFRVDNLDAGIHVMKSILLP